MIAVIRNDILYHALYKYSVNQFSLFFPVLQSLSHLNKTIGFQAFSIRLSSGLWLSCSNVHVLGIEQLQCSFGCIAWVLQPWSITQSLLMKSFPRSWCYHYRVSLWWWCFPNDGHCWISTKRCTLFPSDQRTLLLFAESPNKISYDLYAIMSFFSLLFRVSKSECSGVSKFFFFLINLLYLHMVVLWTASLWISPTPSDLPLGSWVLLLMCGIWLLVDGLF